MFQQVAAQMGRSMGAGADGKDVIGMDLMGMIMDMPLRSVLGFQADALPAAPELIVAGLLQQVYAL